MRIFTTAIQVFLVFLINYLYSWTLEFTRSIHNFPQNSGEPKEVSARADRISRVSSSLLWLAVTRPSTSLEHSFSNTKKRWADLLKQVPVFSSIKGLEFKESLMG